MIAIWLGKRNEIKRRYFTYRRIRLWGIWTPLMRIYMSRLPTRQLRRLHARKPWAVYGVRKPGRVLRKKKGE